MPNNDLEKRRNEFFSNVWNHSEDEFQSAFDERRPLTKKEIYFLHEIVRRFDAGEPDAKIAEYLKVQLSTEDPKLIEILLQICGMTRNKILQDLKASSGEERQKLKLSSHLGLAKHDLTWSVAGSYLAVKLRRVLASPLSLPANERMFEALNQATWPGYIRQERAKRSGHEAEYRIATLLSKCEIPFVPEEKAQNPLCRDALWKGVSFDIIIPDIVKPVVCVKSTVHTANIGQYGESKDHLEIDEARRMINGLPTEDRPVLVGFIDGVGFESNSAGLDGVLSKADEFCQFNTIWKLVVIACSKLGRICVLKIPCDTKSAHKEFLDRYGNFVKYSESRQIDFIKAGGVYIKIR